MMSFTADWLIPGDAPPIADGSVVVDGDGTVVEVGRGGGGERIRVSLTLGCSRCGAHEGVVSQS